MKIAITSQGPELDSAMDQRFGRCPYVLIVETDDMTFQAVKNPYAEETGGVGSRLASLIVKQAVQAVVTEKCGPHAQDALRAAGIPMIALCAATVRQAVDQYKTTQVASPTSQHGDEMVPTAVLSPDSGGAEPTRRKL